MMETATKHLPTIVYVEDNAGDATLLQEALDERGFSARLVIFENGGKALRYFAIKASANDVPPPHCILLDAHVPVEAGIQLLSFVRGNRMYDDTPVYIFADKSQYHAALRNIVVSEESYLAKPDTWDRFLLLADLLMKSAVAKQDGLPASPTDSKPEVHAQGSLRGGDGVR